MPKVKSIILRLALVAALPGGAVLAKAAYDTLRAPAVERLVVESPALAPGAPPVTIALLADIHVAGPDMPPERLGRIVAEVNALRPDLVAVAGDFISEKTFATRIYTAEEAVAPLRGLAAPLGVVVVPGNHDHWFGWEKLSSALARLPRVTVLRNEAAVIGPLVIGGVDDDTTRQANLPATVAAMAGQSGVRVVLSHSPDVFPQVPTDVTLTLAGHTHCGQIAWPWGGSPVTMSAYDQLYACGVKRQYGKTLVTTAGLGTSLLPLRLFTHPEVWLIEIRPPQR